MRSRRGDAEYVRNHDAGLGCSNNASKRRTGVSGRSGVTVWGDGLEPVTFLYIYDELVGLRY